MQLSPMARGLTDRERSLLADGQDWRKPGFDPEPSFIITQSGHSQGEEQTMNAGVTASAS
jgi:hypothetical protein